MSVHATQGVRQTLANSATGSLLTGGVAAIAAAPARAAKQGSKHAAAKPKVTTQLAAAAGRSLFGSMQVTSSSGAVIGRSDVLINAVTG